MTRCIAKSCALVTVGFKLLISRSSARILLFHNNWCVATSLVLASVLGFHYSMSAPSFQPFAGLTMWEEPISIAVLATLAVWKAKPWFEGGSGSPRNPGVSGQAIAIIGTTAWLEVICTPLAKQTRVCAVIDHSAITADALAEALLNVVALERNGAIRLVVLAADRNDPPNALDHVLEYLRAAPIAIALCTCPFGAMISSGEYFSIAGIPMSLMAERPLTSGDMLLKMVLDKLGALVFLALALPLFLAVALAILLETGGPIIFSQQRNGWCGYLFTVYKFRTMHHAQGQHALYQTMRSDPRCTRVGAFLRRTSLDELPQLWNVLRGDMSLVGPRPHADFMHARERARCGPPADYAQRQRVKPGLTGWAQVHGLRGAADTPEKLKQRVEFDRYYIENWSIWLDLKIIVQTPWAVLSRENAF